MTKASIQGGVEPPQSKVLRTEEGYYTCLYSDNLHQLLHRGGGFLECGLLFRRQFDLNDLFDATRAQLYRHAHEQPIDSVLTLKIGRAGQDFLAVIEDGVDHLHHCRGGRIERAAGFEQGHDFAAALARAVDDLVELAPWA